MMINEYIRLIWFLLISVALCSCEKKQNQHDTAVFQRPLVDTILIELPVNVSTNLIRPHLFYHQDAELLLTYDYFDHSLVVIDLSKRAYLDKIPLLKEGPDFLESVGAMAVLNKDSIAVASQNYISILNFEGRVIDRFRINSDNPELYGMTFDKVELKYNQYTGLQFSSTQNSILMQINNFQRLESQKNRGSRLAEIDLKSKRIKALDIVMPEDFAALDGAYGDLTSAGFFREGSNVIYNFPLSSDVFVYSKNDVKRYAVPSQFADDIVSPISDFSQGPNVARFVHKKKSANYLPVYYDSYRKLYYRVHKASVDNIDDEAKYFLMVMDSDFNILREESFPTGYYAFPILSKEGLMFMAFNKHDDKLELIRYRFN